MATARHKAIAERMNGLCTDRTFTGNEIALIENILRIELADRKAEGLIIESKKMDGKKLINIRIAARINAIVKNPMSYLHIKIYKQCWEEEFSERTGKCSWGYANTRARTGYDPKTGVEISDVV